MEQETNKTDANVYEGEEVEQMFEGTNDICNDCIMDMIEGIIGSEKYEG